jgi:hypothetical protein
VSLLTIQTETERVFARHHIIFAVSGLSLQDYDVFSLAFARIGFLHLHPERVRFEGGRVFFPVAVWTTRQRLSDSLDDDPPEPVRPDRLFTGEIEARFTVGDNGWQVRVEFVYPVELECDGGYHGVRMKGINP